MEALTGMPVYLTLAAASVGKPFEFTYEVAIRSTRDASSRLARPSTTFCSWMAVL